MTVASSSELATFIFLTDLNLLNNFSKNARLYILNNFDSEIIKDEYTKLYKSISE